MLKTKKNQIIILMLSVYIFHSNNISCMSNIEIKHSHKQIQENKPLSHPTNEFCKYKNQIFNHIQMLKQIFNVNERIELNNVAKIMGEEKPLAFNFSIIIQTLKKRIELLNQSLDISNVENKNKYNMMLFNTKSLEIASDEFLIEQKIHDIAKDKGFAIIENLTEIATSIRNFINTKKTKKHFFDEKMHKLRLAKKNARKDKSINFDEYHQDWQIINDYTEKIRIYSRILSFTEDKIRVLINEHIFSITQALFHAFTEIISITHNTSNIDEINKKIFKDTLTDFVLLLNKISEDLAISLNDKALEENITQLRSAVIVNSNIIKNLADNLNKDQHSVNDDFIQLYDSICDIFLKSLLFSKLDSLEIYEFNDNHQQLYNTFMLSLSKNIEAKNLNGINQLIKLHNLMFQGTKLNLVELLRIQQALTKTLTTNPSTFLSNLNNFFDTKLFQCIKSSLNAKFYVVAQVALFTPKLLEDCDFSDSLILIGDRKKKSVPLVLCDKLKLINSLKKQFSFNHDLLHHLNDMSDFVVQFKTIFENILAKVHFNNYVYGLDYNKIYDLIKDAVDRQVLDNSYLNYDSLLFRYEA